MMLLCICYKQKAAYALRSSDWSSDVCSSDLMPGATIIADVKASQMLYDRIAELGGEPLMWKTGHSLIKTKMRETGAPLAGEMSGHIFFAHDYYGFDDAQYAAVRLIRAVHMIGKSLTQIRGEMPNLINTPEMRFQVDEPRKFAIGDAGLDRLEDAGAEGNRNDGGGGTTPAGWRDERPHLLRARLLRLRRCAICRRPADPRGAYDRQITDADPRRDAQSHQHARTALSGRRTAQICDRRRGARPARGRGGRGQPDRRRTGEKERRMVED